MDAIFELVNRYATEQPYEPKAYINGVKLTKSQLVNILSVLDQQASDYEDPCLITMNDITVCIDSSRDVYVNDGKYLDKDTINAWMEGYHINMADLSRKTGISYQTINNIVKGRVKASDDTKDKIVKALYISTQ